MNAIEEYTKELVEGQISASRRVTAVFKRLVEKIHNPADGYHFDEARANRPIEFIERFCRHSKGEWAGQPMKLLLFQKAFISALFGFVDDNGLRQYRESFFYVSRKNGKSTMLAALALYCMVADGEGGAEVYSAATKKDQAALVFEEACRMVQQSPALRKNIRKRKSDLYFDRGFAKFKPLGKNSDTLDGLNAHLIIIDEMHSIKDRNLYEVLKQSQSARRQGLLISITTAGTLRENIFDDMYRYACGVADGTIDDKTFLPILYELDEKAEYLKPECWQKANPALGAVKKVEDLQTKVKRAAQSPNDLVGVLTKDFNVIENVAQAWLTFEDLNNTETLDLARFRNYYCVGGVDLSRTTDLTCATLLILGADEKRYVAQMYWLPSEGFEDRVRQEKIPFDKWHEQGWLRLCAGNTIRYSDVTAWFLEVHEKYEISPVWIYFDAWSARYFVDEMTADGFTMVPCRQGAKTLSIPMQTLGADLQAKRVNYNNNPILKWCLSNTGVLEDRNGGIVPVKASGRKNRIDGTAALIDAYVGLCEHYDELLDAAGNNYEAGDFNG